MAGPSTHPDSKTETPILREEQHWKKNMEECGGIMSVIFEVTSRHRLSSAEEKLKLGVICEETGIERRGDMKRQLTDSGRHWEPTEGTLASSSMASMALAGLALLPHPSAF